MNISFQKITEGMTTDHLFKLLRIDKPNNEPMKNTENPGYINHDVLHNHIQHIEDMKERIHQLEHEIHQRNQRFIKAHCPFQVDQFIHQVEKDGKEIPHKIIEIRFNKSGWQSLDGVWEIHVQRWLMDKSRSAQNVNPTKVFSWQTWKEEGLPKGRGKS